MARGRMSTPDRARETGQFFLAFCAYSSKAAAVTFEIDPVDGPPAVTLLEVDLRCQMDVFDSEAHSGQLKRQRHREAPRMGSAKQFGFVPLPSAMRERKSYEPSNTPFPSRMWPEPRARFPRDSGSAVLIAITPSNQSRLPGPRERYRHRAVGIRLGNY